MILTHAMKCAKVCIDQAMANLSDSVGVDCEDPDYSLSMAKNELLNAIREIENARMLIKLINRHGL